MAEGVQRAEGEAFIMHAGQVGLEDLPDRAATSVSGIGHHAAHADKPAGVPLEPAVHLQQDHAAQQPALLINAASVLAQLLRGQLLWSEVFRFHGVSEADGGQLVVIGQLLQA